MLQKVFDRVRDNRLQDVLVDFECAAVEAFHLIDENIDMKGCFYHLFSNIWKKVQHFGLNKGNEDQEFALHTRMFCAVVFMPPDNVIAGFKELSDLITNTYQGEMDDLLDYFEETFVGRYCRNAERRPPLLALNLWNMFYRTFDKLPRTNNHVEGWHRRFKRIYRRGHPPPAQRRRYVDANERILATADDFQNRGNMEYLRAIAHNLGF